MNEQPKKRPFRWYHALIIWSALILAAGFAGCAVLYKYLGVYEVTRPETVMEEVIKSEGTEGLMALALESFDDGDYPFEDIRALFKQYCQGYVTGNELSFTEYKSAGTGDRAVYAVRAGAAPFCTVTLGPEPGTDMGFGRHGWRLDSVSADETIASFDSVTIRVDAVSGEEFTLNGRTAGPEYITETGLEPAGITEIEKRFASRPTADRYEIGPIYGDVVVRNSAGDAVPPSDSGGSVVCYQIAPETRSVTVSAPDDYTVSICGAELTADDASGLSEGIFKGLDKYTGGNGWLTAVYHFEGIYQEPVVTVTDRDGNTVEPVNPGGERYYYTRSDEEHDEECESAARNFFSAYMNYSAKGSGLYTLLGKIQRGSALYDYVASSHDAMIWASKTSAQYKDISFGNFCRVSDKCFTCTVSYSADMTATAWTGQYTYSLENVYQLVFVKESGWKASVMEDLAA